MSKYSCSRCKEDSPRSGGIYYKSYSAEEKDMKDFLFPVYMCNECELEFIIMGCRFINGKNVWQDSDVVREDFDGW